MHDPCDAQIFCYATLLQVFCAGPVASRPDRLARRKARLAAWSSLRPGFSSVDRAQGKAMETPALSLPPAESPFRLLPLSPSTTSGLQGLRLVGDRTNHGRPLKQLVRCGEGRRGYDSRSRRVRKSGLGVITATFPSPRAATTALGLAIRRLAESVATPLLPDDYLDLVAPMRATAELAAESCQGNSRDPACRYGPDPSRQVVAGHLPGQYIRVGVDVDGVRHWRAYSLTSPTTSTDGLVSITVKAIPNGTVSNHMVRLLAPGTLVHLDQALGRLRPATTAAGSHLFVTAGSGITPVMGLLRNHLADLPDVVLVHSAPTGDDVIFGDQLRDWARAGRLRLVERHTATAGILDPAHLDDLVPIGVTGNRGPAARSGCWTRWRRTGPTPASPSASTPSDSGQPDHRGGRGHRDLPAPRCCRRGRWRHAHSRRRRGRRCLDAVRLPNGHLPRVCRSPPPGGGPRPAGRAADHRRGR